MFNWISKLFENLTVDIPETINTEWLKNIEDFLLPLNKQKIGNRTNPAKDIIEYVLKGENITILSDLHNADDTVFEKLGVKRYGKNTKLKIYNLFTTLPPEVALRWALLLDSCASKAYAGNFSYVFPGNISWPETLLLHVGDAFSSYYSDGEKIKGLTLDYFEQILTAAALPPESLIVSAFVSPVDSGYYAQYRLKDILRFSDFDKAVKRHAGSLLPLFRLAKVNQRLHMLDLLKDIPKETLAIFTVPLAELTVSSSKQARGAAEVLLRKNPSEGIDVLKKLALSGKPEERLNAYKLLWSFGQEVKSEETLSFAIENAAKDKASSVNELVEQWNSTTTQTESEIPYAYELPVLSLGCSSTPELDKALQVFGDALNREIEQANKSAQSHHEWMLKNNHKHTLKLLTSLDNSLIVKFKEYLLSDTDVPSVKMQNPEIARFAQNASKIFADQNGITAIMLFKLLRFFSVNKTDIISWNTTKAINALYSRTHSFSLLEVQKILAELHSTDTDLIKMYCSSYNSIGSDWDEKDVWPFVAHNQDKFIAYLSNQKNDYYLERSGLFKAIATLPYPPSAIVNTLFDLALGSSKSDRKYAQISLSKYDGKEQRIVTSLASGKADVRIAATQWLSDLKCNNAIGAIETALAKESNDLVKGVMLDALQAFGQPVEQYIDRKKLLDDAHKSAAKEPPKELAWFLWDALPEVHWEDSKELVHRDIIKFLITQSVKQKNPEPNALVRKYCSMFVPKEREQLGQYILESWIQEDIRPITPDEALQRAQAQAQSIHGYMNSHPQYYKDDPNFGKSVEEITAAYLPQLVRTPAGSAIGCKGMLSLAAACATGRAASVVAKYLKEYYGTRAAQGKALIAMLAWIEHPTATQLMLSVGNRFRTKSFQEEATRQAEALAERKGWTLSELADRTIPSAGFDELGILELSYGIRTFTAKLLPDFKIELYNPDDKKIASLPEPRQDDDQELAKESKKALSNAKKEIKSVITLQSERLYESLCTERQWLFDDWNRYLNNHSIMRRLVQRLIWVVVDNNKIIATFRPLDDGTLTDVDDNEVKLDTTALIRIAHDTNLSGELVTKWQQHLVDYEIVPLFQQFGKGSYALPEEKAKLDTITDFEGYLVNSYALRGKATKLGYTRGAAEDGGWFYTYEKRFPTLGLNAILEFTGSPLPEEDRTVALKSLYFEKSASQSDYWSKNALLLSSVPKILVSECYNDLRLIAAEGSGFDSEWEKKSSY